MRVYIPASKKPLNPYVESMIMFISSVNNAILALESVLVN